MRRLIIPAVAAAVLAVSSLAYAAETVYAAETTTGTITSINPKLHTLTLDNGTVFRLPEGYKNPALKEREAVAVTWRMEANDRIASDVKILSYDQLY
jgi:hypothetical protein